MQKHLFNSSLAVYFLIRNKSQSLGKTLPVIFAAPAGLGPQLTGDAPLRLWFKHCPVGAAVEKGSDSG